MHNPDFIIETKLKKRIVPICTVKQIKISAIYKLYNIFTVLLGSSFQQRKKNKRCHHSKSLFHYLLQSNLKCYSKQFYYVNIQNGVKYIILKFLIQENLK